MYGDKNSTFQAPMKGMLITICVLLCLASVCGLGHVSAEEERSSAGLLRMGDEAYATGKYSRAVELYREALQSDEKNSMARLKLIELLARLAGKEDEAKREIEAALAMESLTKEEIGLIAEVCRANRFPQQARLAYERLVKNSPDDFAVLGKLIEILISQKQFEEAIQKIEAYRDSSSRTVEGLEALAATCMEHSAHWIAQIAYSAILKRDEKNLGALLGLSGSLVIHWQFPEAITALSQAVKYYPEKAEPRVALRQLLLRTGDYERAEEAFLKALQSQPENVEAVKGRAEVLFSTGRYEEARQIVSEALKAHPDSPLLLVALGELLHYTGEHESARKQFEKALTARAGCPQALLGLGLSYRAAGEQDTAKRHFFRLYDFYDAHLNDLGSVKPGDLVAVATACALTDNPQDAVDVLEKILKMDPTNAEALLLEARLFAERHQPADSSRELKKLLDMNPNHAEAHAELASLHLDANQYEQATEHCEQALKANPNLIRALDILCSLQILDFEYKKAEETAKKALSINPHSLSSLSALASCYWQKRDKDAYEEVRKQVFTINPAYSEFYMTVARACENKRRNEEAMEVLKEALSLTPDSAQAHSMMGTLLMREGEEREAEKHLQRAYRLDRYNPKTANVLNLLRHMKENFASTRTEHFLIQWEKEKDDPLIHFLPEYLERVYAEVCEEFRYEPRNPTLVQIFASHDQFSARIVGLPFIATVGASLGKIVAMDSPKMSRFDWKDVLRHEFIHVVTLQQSKMQIPFWLTEGLATYYEESPRPRHWDALLARMLYLNHVIPLSDLNSYFTRPKTGMHKQAAYAQSLLICRYLYEEFGGEVIRKMIEMYGDNFTTEEVIRECLSMSQAEFEEEIRERVFHEAKTMRYPPSFMPGDGERIEKQLKEKPGDAVLTIAHAMWLCERATGRTIIQRLMDDAEAIVRELVDKDPKAPHAYALLAGFDLSRGDYENAEHAALKAIDIDGEDFMAHRCLGYIYERIGAVEKAITEFGRAVELYPRAADVWVKLSHLYAKQKDREGSIRSLEGHLRANPRNLADAKRLVALYFPDNELGKAVEVLERTLRYNPYDPGIYKLLAEACQGQGDEESAKKYAKIGAEAGYAAARSLAPAQTRQMIKLLIMSLELDPDHEKAKALLKQIGGDGAVPKEPIPAPAEEEGGVSLRESPCTPEGFLTLFRAMRPSGRRAWASESHSHVASRNDRLIPLTDGEHGTG